MVYHLEGSVVKAKQPWLEYKLISRTDGILGLGIILKNKNAMVKNSYLNAKEVHILDFCQKCVLGKVHKLPVTNEILGYVHNDL